MEQEIDLRPYAQAVLRQWLLIVVVVALAAGAAFLWTSSRPVVATALGDVLVVARTSQLILDPRFVDRDATMLTNAINQRQALIDLASSPELEARVAAALGRDLTYSGALLSRIRVTAQSDLLRITATGATSEEALRLAETWSSSYEAFINDVYRGGSDVVLDETITASQQDYEQSLAELAAFYEGGDLVRAEQAVIRAEGVLSGTLAADVSLYTRYISRTEDLSLILEDARALQAQYEVGATDLGAAVATLVVRARLAGAEELPIQLSFNSADALGAAQEAAPDLAAFVRVLEAERDRMAAQAEAVAAALAAGSAPGGLSAEAREGYEAELAAARSALARAEGEERRLLLQRDVALRSLEALQAKRSEFQIDQSLPEVSVRFVGAAAQPIPSRLAGLQRNMIAAVVGSLALVIVVIVIRELLRPSVSTRSGARASSERAADTPVASD